MPAERRLTKNRASRYDCAMSITSKVRHKISLARLEEGGAYGKAERLRECTVIDRLTASGVLLESVEFSGNECSFIIDARKRGCVESVAGDLNVGVAVRDDCACLTLTRLATDLPLPSLSALLHALEEQHIELFHLAADFARLQLVVDERDVHRVAGIIERFYAPAVTKRSA